MESRLTSAAFPGSPTVTNSRLACPVQTPVTGSRGETVTEALITALAALAGGAGGCVLACVPGAHVYNVMGGLLLAAHAGYCDLPSSLALPLFAGLVAGYAVGNSVPAVLVAAPDESALFTVLPGQKFLMQGRGRDRISLM